MLKVEAIIRNSVLPDVQQILANNAIPTFSMYQVHMTGMHKAHKNWRNTSSDFIPKSKIEIICSDDVGETIVKLIQDIAKTGEKGDGIVYVYKIDKLVKIRNGNIDEKALS